jgi:hypothetical protein
MCFYPRSSTGSDHLGGRRAVAEPTFLSTLSHGERLGRLIQPADCGEVSIFPRSRTGTEPAKAAKAAATKIPIVFVSAADPVRTGLEVGGADMARDRHGPSAIDQTRSIGVTSRLKNQPGEARQLNHPAAIWTHWRGAQPADCGRAARLHVVSNGGARPQRAGKAIHWLQEPIRRAASAMRESRSNDLLILARVALQAAIPVRRRSLRPSQRHHDTAGLSASGGAGPRIGDGFLV